MSRWVLNIRMHKTMHSLAGPNELSPASGSRGSLPRVRLCMGSPSIASWTSAIKAVAKLVDGPAADPPASAVRCVVQPLVALFKGPPLPHAAVKKLVLEIKAPKAAAMLCMRALQRHPRSTALLDAATALLEAVLKCSQRRPGRASSNDARIAASTLQQLQQAGLMQQLPALMAAAAEGLAAASKAAAAAAAAHIRYARSSSGGDGSGSADTDGLAAQCTDLALIAAFRKHGLAMSCASSTLYVCLHILGWSADESDSLWQTAVAVCMQAGPAAAQLILAVFEASSRLSVVQRQARPAAPAEGGEQQAAGVKQPQHQLLRSLLREYWDEDADLREAMAVSLTLFLRLAVLFSPRKLGQGGSSTAGSSPRQGAGQVSAPAGPGTPDLKAVMCSPELQRCQTLLLCVILTAAQAQPAASSSRSTDSRVQAASRRRAQGPAGLGAATDSRRVSGMQHQCTTSPGSQGHAAAEPGGSCGAAAPLGCSSADRLFELLGVSQATVMQAAGFCDVGDADDALHYVMLFAGLHTRVCELQAPDREERGVVTQEQLVQAERGLLLSVMLLQYLNSLPSGRDDSVTEQACFTVASTAQKLCGLALRDVRGGGGVREKPLPADGAVPADAGQPDGAPGQQQGVSSRDQGQPHVRCLLVPPAPVLAELLPLLVRLSQPRLQLLQPPDATHAAGSGTPASVVAAAAATAASHLGRSLAAASQHGRAAASDFKVSLVMQLTAVTCVTLLGELVAATAAVSLKPGAAASTAAAAGAAESAAAGGTLPAAAPDSSAQSVLHSQEVFAPHAGDIVACFEAATRMCMTQHHLPSFVDVGQTKQQVDTALALACAAGLGPGVLQQTYSLFSTLQRNLSMQNTTWDGSAKSSTEIAACLSVAEGAAALLSEPQAAPGQQAQQHRENQGEQPLKQQQQQQQQSLLASLVIIGRCFLQLAAMLQPTAAPGGLPGAKQQRQTMPAGAQQGVLAQFHHWPPMRGCHQGAVVKVAAIAQQWLQAHSQPLAAAGYGPGRVLQQLEKLLAALEAMVQSSSSAGSTSQDLDHHDGAMVQQLQLAGAALSSLPVPCLCNNPGCTNAAGLSELGLVSGRSCVCGGCRVAHYCGRSCQRSHWKQHKPVCTALAAAAVAGGAAAAAEPDSVSVGRYV